MHDGLVRADVRHDELGRPAEFLNVVITGPGRRMVADHDRAASVGIAVASVHQSGGITAHIVNIAQPHAFTPAAPAGKERPWWKRTWVVVSGAAAFAAAVLKVLDYFHVHP